MFLKFQQFYVSYTLPKINSTPYSKCTIHLLEIQILTLMAYLSSQKYF